MKDFAEGFYKSKIWQDARDAYMREVGGLCERCRARGIIKPAVIVHHKKHLTADNIGDPRVTLDRRNLEALCRACHGEVHGHKRRFRVGKDGEIIV